MNILVLGGTGAMGTPLINLLQERSDVRVYVTSRSNRESYSNIVYLHGNAKDYEFFSSLMKKNYDCIIDFMVYSTNLFQERLPDLLKHTAQYVFFSSSRCYAESEGLLTEDSPRLVDVCTDQEYLAIDEYALAKGREENLLYDSENPNWTVIRPYITFNSQRIQLGVYEKENWLRRAIEGRTIVFPNDIAKKTTTLTYAEDVARVLSKMIGNPATFGETFHIASPESHKWGDLLDFYCRTIDQITGTTPKIRMVDNSLGLQNVWSKWQIKYDRLFDRRFDSTKVEKVCGHIEYTPTYVGLENALRLFLSDPHWSTMNYRFEAWCDRLCGEFTPLEEIQGTKMKLNYLKYRIIGSMC